MMDCLMLVTLLRTTTLEIKQIAVALFPILI